MLNIYGCPTARDMQNVLLGRLTVPITSPIGQVECGAGQALSVALVR